MRSSASSSPSPSSSSSRYRISSVDLTRLIEAAQAISLRAYAPYSNFRVGAAVLTGGGSVYTGCNVENASYGLSMCAERNAAFSMVAETANEDDRKIQLVVAVSPDTSPCFPCGACRQVLHEFGCEEVVVLDTSGAPLRYSFEEMLPHAFGPESL